MALYIEQENKGSEKKSAGKVLLATVKGDVHDIGKNIVGVVLSCNNYEIVDLGVMVPADKILDTAVQEKADIVGLSGLITPSLEEMVHVASEMERRKMKLPLLVGGATTSEVHAAVKIAPAYSGSVIHVKDASKAATVVSSLLQQDNQKYVASVKSKYSKIKDEHSARQSEVLLVSVDEARRNKPFTDWNSQKLYSPKKPGLNIFPEISLDELVNYIDWTYFFFAWKVGGKYPAIFDDPVKGAEAKKLFTEAQFYLKEIAKKKIIKVTGVLGLYPANSSGDDVKVYSDEGRKDTRTTFRFLRNQEKRGTGIPNLSLSDFIAPESTGLNDHIGAFVVTAEIDRKEYLKYGDDDYGTIMIRILSDRLAEAAAEWIHEKVRKEYWGYAADENLTFEDMFKLKYKGIRPAPGYPACPDHTEKGVLFDLLGAQENIGATLTESFAMVPPAAVSGYIFAHPQSSYFNIGKIGRDQLEDYAKRKGMSIGEAARWLAPNL
jgi:5-methyltetrahydrofolate--homocysteine methyltransferase